MLHSETEFQAVFSAYKLFWTLNNLGLPARAQEFGYKSLGTPNATSASVPPPTFSLKVGGELLEMSRQTLEPGKRYRRFTM